jgi:hypothetical protein
VLNTTVLGYVVLCGSMGVLYVYMYIYYGGWDASNFQYIFSTDGFMLTCFGGSGI